MLQIIMYLFDVTKYDSYGNLSGRNIDDQLAGSRVEVASYKKNAGDFVLWKPSVDNQPGWESPWGFGRPGWHLECSAMAEESLGLPFDIHAGGMDLIFPIMKMKLLKVVVLIMKIKTLVFLQNIGFIMQC